MVIAGGDDGVGVGVETSAHVLHEYIRGGVLIANVERFAHCEVGRLAEMRFCEDWCGMGVAAVRI